MTNALYRLAAFLSIFVISTLQFAMARQAGLGAHVHGVSELNIAIEGNKLDIQLRSPAMNIVGFEHKAVTANQIVKVKQSEALLKQHASLFSFTKGGCLLSKAEVTLPDLIEEDEASHDHHQDKHEHGHDHKEDHAEHNEHSEIVAHYHYTCEDMDELSTVTLGFFDVFPAMEKIDGMWITETGQGAAVLNIDNKTIRFR